MSRRSEEYQIDLFAPESEEYLHPELIVPEYFDLERAKNAAKHRNAHLDSDQKKLTAGFRSATEQLWVPYSSKEMKTATLGAEGTLRTTYLATKDRVVNVQGLPEKTARAVAGMICSKLQGSIKSGWPQDALKQKHDIEQIFDPETRFLRPSILRILEDHETLDDYYSAHEEVRLEKPAIQQKLAVDGLLLYLVMFRSFSGQIVNKKNRRQWPDTTPVEDKKNPRRAKMRHHKVIHGHKSEIFQELKDSDEDTVDDLVIEGLMSNWSRYRYWRNVTKRMAERAKEVNKMDPTNFLQDLPTDLRIAFVKQD